MVYVHFPYCLQKCPYCDFVSFKRERSLIQHQRYAATVLAELEFRRQLLAQQSQSFYLHSIFFGGGTPSLWDPLAIGEVISALLAAWPIQEQPEITIECNPSSLSPASLAALAQTGANRLSIGVQSLNEERLKFLGRLHDGPLALQCLAWAHEAGFSRVSGDLIFGVTGQSPDEAAAEAEQLQQSGIKHLSAYNLTIEPGTQFGELARRGRLPLLDENLAAASFYAIEQVLEKAGFHHYEISNYAHPGQESQHNLGYWQGLTYLGLGCAAYGTIPRADTTVRYRNCPDPEKYQRWSETLPDSVSETPQQAIEILEESSETLDAETLLRERIMLGLRLADGFDIVTAANELGLEAWTPERQRQAERLVKRNRLEIQGNRLRIPRDARIFADGIIAELF
jgi:putative oxygen-independent coproporphyrinogen III oxidase